jgi:anti-sigma B factor antagonist
VEPLSCTVDHRAGAVIVHVAGEVDMTNAGTLRETLIDVLGADPATHLIVDLSGVEFIDSTGVGVIVGARKRAMSRGGTLTAVVATHAVRRVLETTGLLKAWRVTATVEEALDA